MARRTQNPGSRIDYEVRGFIERLARQRDEAGRFCYTPYKIHGMLREAAWDADYRQALGFSERVGQPAGEWMKVSIGTVKEIVRKARSEATVEAVSLSGRRDAGPAADEEWRWWEAPASESMMVLPAVAAWERVTGMRWPLITRSHVDDLMRLTQVAPDAPPELVAGLALLVDRWRALDPPERERRLRTIGRYLGFAAWRSPEHNDRYMDWATRHGEDVIVLSHLGLPIYNVTLRGTATGTSSAHLEATGTVTATAVTPTDR
jgi:hypothetical protein